MQLRHPRSRAPGGRILHPSPRVLAVVCFLLLSAAAEAASEPRPAHTYNLGPDARAAIDDAGTLVIQAAGAQALRAEVDVAGTPRRRRTGQEPFFGLAAEGAAGGQRGFSARADDDGDGLVDEDPLDGRDNDGDGRTDEDFAAVSDAMAVIHQDGRHATGRHAHLEYYHWAYPRLRSLLFLRAGGPVEPASAGTLTLTAAADWQPLLAPARRHDRTGEQKVVRAGAWAAPLPGAEGRWVGAVLLQAPAGRTLRADGRKLTIGRGPQVVAVAVCVADSWLQLCRLLNDATLVRDGVADPVTGRRVPWVVPPLCAACRLGETPAYSWRRNENGDIVLTAELDPQHACAADPDLFRGDGRGWGSPAAIRWISQDRDGHEHTASITWLPMSADLVQRPHGHLSDPYGAFAGFTQHGSSGRLEWVFPAGNLPESGPGDLIAGVAMDGRPFSASLARTRQPAASIFPAAPEVSFPSTGPGTDAGSGDLFVPDRSRALSLAPGLLNGWPNPFNDVVQIHFRVPESLGETFDWEDYDNPPDAAALAAPMSWGSGQPRASVKIYNLNGQELVSLESSSLGPGDYTVQWDGTDAFGRKVASGKYFCKLQLDDWSVTRRLTFLR